jgi:serine/threonine protein kinase
VETKAQWTRIKELFGAALEREPAERSAFLQEACGEDIRLRQEIESLLEAHDARTQLPESAWNIPPAEQLKPRSIGPYQLLGRIGEGGMGQVWLAEQAAPLHRRVALKLIRWGTYDDTLLHRFQAERQSLAVMDHPSIAKVFDAGATAEGQPYFVMEYVPGIPITKYCDQKKLEIRERLKLFITVCEGVQHAHQKAIIHRDLKPANILVAEVDGKPVPRIIDFGLAKAIHPGTNSEPIQTRVGSFLGTPGYMSPEQCDPSTPDVDTRADVYSLGVVLYVLLSGDTPFDPRALNKKPIHEVLSVLRQQEPRQPSTRVSSDRDASSAAAEARGADPKQLAGQLKGDLDWITMKAIEKDRARRYGTPSELADDIARYLRYEPVNARPAGMLYRLGKYAHRHRIGVAVATVLAVLLVMFGIAQTIQLRKTTRERDRADRIAQFMTGIFRVANPGEQVGSTVTARQVLDKASADVNTGLSKDPDLQARMMYTMGMAYLNLGVYSRAQSLFEQSIQAADAAGEAEGADNLRTTQRLAWTLFQEGRLGEAETQQRRLVDIERHLLGPQNSETVGTMGDLATTLDEEGHSAESEKLQREVLQVQKRVLGSEATPTLASMDNLATTLLHEGRAAEAEEFEHQALQTRLRISGPENLTSIHYMMNEANIKATMGMEDEAEKLLRQVLDLERRVLGPDQPETAVTVYNLATVVAKRGRFDEAFSLMRESVEHGLPRRVALGIGGDPDLSMLHSDPRFSELITYANEHANAQKSALR